MKCWLSVFATVLATVLLLSSCAQPSIPAPAPPPTESTGPPAEEAQGKTIIVTSTADSGLGTLRQALLDAQSGDSITFDTAAFPPSTPATIYLTSGLSPVTQGNLTINASDAGVILNGSHIGEEFVPVLEIVSNGNTVQGLQIVNFSPGAGIVLSGGAQNNMIGVDR